MFSLARDLFSAGESFYISTPYTAKHLHKKEPLDYQIKQRQTVLHYSLFLAFDRYDDIHAKA